MKRIYQINYSPVIGNVAYQVVSMGGEEEENSCENIEENMSLDYTPNFDKIVLDDDAKLTDNISQSYMFTMGLLVSEKLKNLIGRFNVQPYQVFPAKVEHLGVSHNYYWIHFVANFGKNIDFDCSVFRKKSFEDFSTEKIKFDNYDDLMEKTSDWIDNMEADLSIEKISFSNLKEQVDLFFINTTGYKLMASEAFCESLEKEKISGYEIKKAEVYLMS